MLGVGLILIKTNLCQFSYSSGKTLSVELTVTLCIMHYYFSTFLAI